jgi:putative oxidoreductase
VLVGLFTRLAVLPLIGVMVVAIVSTKIPILLGEGFWGFELRKLPQYGFWSMAHEARTDFSMVMGASFLLLVGAGPRSIDHRIAARGAA